MILFNTVVPEKNPTTANHFGVNNMPVVAVDIVKPVEHA
jgi:hypothetical protein